MSDLHARIEQTGIRGFDGKDGKDGETLYISFEMDANGHLIEHGAGVSDDITFDMQNGRMGVILQ
ncbi:hypothetical protein [Butyrivibrio virus Bo-Finn]|jgi:hypothetical protein|nr:hypothetical protein [Butyrivibrio virus Arian]QHJ73724.1 hypothetical protein [Butyrivibrio virus Bo-Finn]